ncbi:phage protein Gp27 family protein [Serratia plymuthica]|uniref:phage protein Gp27 family protein n=1 Tax=Serratia plymuthica TaxID=82996 RepID=UPI000937E37E|nr:phage protein Gp27 family protein [Serratia plymuthica]OJT38451.1 small terminase subunit [Serratia plymuthica]
MGRKSTIHKLATDVRAHIERRLREDQLTLDELLDDIRQHFPDTDETPSRSALGRYKQSFGEMVGRMREQDQMARLLVSELGENPDERAGALMVQAVTTLTSHATFAALEQAEPDIDTVRHLARAAKDVLQARKSSLDERREIEREARARLLQEQNENLEKVATAQGLSEDQVQFWREKFLGIK